MKKRFNNHGVPVVIIYKGEDGKPFDPKKHQNAFMVMRILNVPGKTVWWLGGVPIIVNANGITIVGRGDHCADCAANVNEILSWIEQALTILNRQIPRGIPLGQPLDRGIATYGFTNTDAEDTDVALQAIKDRWGSDPGVAILVWRKTPNGLEWECVGDNCQYFSDEELEAMACKEATGSAKCDACEGFRCQEEHNSSNSSDPGDQVGATPPDPTLPCVGEICALGS
ncbi:MAG: hypothetical protein ACUVRH_01465 [Candidatus Bipolaricaulia bacterium]